MEFEVGPMGKPRQPDSGGLVALAAGLVRRLADDNADSNLVFSPLSIYTALALLAAGARGATLDEILRVLGARSRDGLEEFVSRMAEDALRDLSSSGGPCVAFACGVWSDLTCPLKPAYRDALVGAYKAKASTVDFRNNPEGSGRQINAWVAQVTRNLINSVLGPGSITPITRVVLGNAIYFKGKWDQPFDRRHTANKLFYRHDGRTIDVPFMQSQAAQFIAVHDGFKVLKLRYKMAQGYLFAEANPGGRRVDPFNRAGHDDAFSPKKLALYSGGSNPALFCRHAPYAHPNSFTHVGSPGHPNASTGRVGPSGHTNAFGLVNPLQRTDPLKGYAEMSSNCNKFTQFSMCIFLPDAYDGLRSLIDMIASRPGFLHEHLPETKIDVKEFRVPKFKLSFQSSVVAVLKKLGLQLPFCNQADLSDMVEDDGSGLPMVVNDVIHKAVIEVNEEGTEAAAVTMISGGFGCGIPPPPPPRVDFVADHPFAYFIVEESTGAVVFAGHVLDPIGCSNLRNFSK